MRCGDGDPSYFYPLCPRVVEAKLKEIEERYRGELRERKACVTFETELGRQLKALITSVQTEQSKCARTHITMFTLTLLLFHVSMYSIDKTFFTMYSLR